MLAHRLRLWANNKSTLVQDLVFSGLHAIFLWTEGVNPIRPGAPGQWESGLVGRLRSGGSRFGDLSDQDPTQQTKDVDPALVYCWTTSATVSQLYAKTGSTSRGQGPRRASHVSEAIYR